MRLSGKIIATVVTHNRLALLQRCLKHLRMQSLALDSIIVVDNDSTDGTAAWLDEQTDLHVLHQPNLGSAGGQARGLLEAYKMDATWIWMMDDDGYPAADCLEKLVEVGKMGVPYVSPALTSPEGASHYEGLYENTPARILDHPGGPFNGILVNRWIPEYSGYPVPDFFIWGEEFEFLDRIQKYRFPCLNVRDAIFYHPLTTIDYRTNKRLFYLFRNAIWRLRLYPVGSDMTKSLFALRQINMLLRSFGKVLVSGNLRGMRDALKGLWRGVASMPELGSSK